MKATYRHWVTALIVAVGVLAAAQAFADPPARVARLNYLKGSVSFRPASVDDWAPATLNYPLTTGDHLWTDNSSWAEMHVGSTAIRLAPTTAFAFLNLDDRTTQVRLTEGALDVRVRNLDGSESFEIDTPSAAIALSRPGVYRVDVLPDGGSTRVTVRYGLASVSADGPDFWVRDGETAAVYGTDEVSHEIFRAAAPDNWERWCRTRDEREDRVASVRYVSYEMTGYEDLDEYGTWSTVPEYGWAWRPHVAGAWAPYRYGQWRWVYPWGWTWVDDAPWGFAPFHYGRWACLRGSWYWVPGSYALRPIYSPALVAFIGGDNWGFSIGFGRGHVGWFPLAPGEFWMPHYRASHHYIRNLNVTNVNVTNINITNYNVSRGTYVNRAIAGAVTAVPRDSFLGGRAVARDAVGVDARAVVRAPVVGTSASVAPRVDSVLGSRRNGYVARPSSSVLDRTVVARTQPPAPPAPFAAQERALQANGGRPLDDTAMARLRTETGSRADGGAPVRIAGARGGFRGDPARGDSAVRGDAARGDSVRGNAAGSEQPAGGTYGGVATRRGGERVVPENSRPGGTASIPGSVRPEANDRPGWARPRGGTEAQPANPGYGGEDRAGVRGRPGALAPQGGESNRGGTAGDRPGGTVIGGARPRGGERTAPGGDSAQPTPNDRPGFGRPSGGGETTRPSGGETARPSGGETTRPSGGETTRPSGGQSARPSGGENRGRPSGGDTNTRPDAPAGARPRGGEARPAPQSPPPGQTARPRSGGRGGDSVSYESSARPSYTNDRPPQARSWGGQATSVRPSVSNSPSYRSVPDSRPSPQYRSMPESRPTPQYRAMPESRPTPQYRAMPESRPTPQYRAMPESRPTPQYRAMPETRPTPQYRAMPESRPTPQYRAMPESRPTPQYRSMPESRPMPQYSPRGGERAPQAAPRQQPQSGGGGQAAPRGGARSRGRG